MRALRVLLKSGFNEDASRLKNHQVIRGVARRVASGLIQVLELPESEWFRNAKGGGKSEQPPAPVTPPTPVIPIEPERQTFRLVEVIEVVKRGREGGVAGAAPAPAGGDYPRLSERTEKDGDAFKQFINLGKEIEGGSKKHPEYGRFIELRARIEWVSGDKSKSLAGKKVHWSYVIGPHSGNKRPGTLDGAQKEGFSSSGGARTHIAVTDKAGWTPVVKFYFSQYAGDRFTVAAQADVAENGTPSGDQCKAGPYAVWRKFWYQVTHAAEKHVDPPEQSADAYKQLAADMLEAANVTFSKNEVTDAARTFYPNWMVAGGNNATEDVVVGGHNRDWFYAKFKKETHRPVKGHLIICDHQWDPAGVTGLHTFNLNAGTQTAGAHGSRSYMLAFDLRARNAGIVKPALSGKLVALGQWKVNPVPSGTAAPANKQGTLTDAHISVVQGRSGLNRVKLTLPANCPDPAQYPMKIYLKLRYGKFYAGESNKHQMLIVYRSGQSAAFNQVTAHEFGHGFAQVPRPGGQPSSLVDHPKQYTNEHGGVGSHCSTAAVLTADDQYPAGLYRNGTCIMFHQVNPAGCTQTFCADCEPYLRLQDMKAMG